MTGEPVKNVQIEALRAVAIVYTLVHHLPIAIGHLPDFYYWLYKYTSFHIGVDLFFVISGFVITLSLCNSVEKTKAAKWRLMLAFWLKRVFRLLPLAWFWLFVAGVYLVVRSLLPGAQDEEGFLLAPILAALFQVANFYSAYCGEAQSASAVICDTKNISGHYWSLSLEEQFYIVYPLLFFMVNRKFLIAALCIAVVAQIFWLRPIGSYGWYFRTDALAYGVLLGFFCKTNAYAVSVRALSNHRHVLTFVMLILIMALPIVSRQVEGFGGTGKFYGVAAIAFVCAAIVLIASYDFKVFRETSVLRQVLLYLGARSYSLYVAHFLLFHMLGSTAASILAGLSLSPMFTSMYHLSTAALSLLLTLAVSELSYRYVESPFRPKGRQLATQILNPRS